MRAVFTPSPSGHRYLHIVMTQEGRVSRRGKEGDQRIKCGSESIPLSSRGVWCAASSTGGLFSGSSVFPDVWTGVMGLGTSSEPP